MLSFRLLRHNFLHKNKSLSLLPTLVRNYSLVWLSTETPEYAEYIDDTAEVFPESEMPQPAEYNGERKLRVAYVMDRNPSCTAETHPIVQDFEKLKEENVARFARHQYTSFVDYYPAWRQTYNKLSEKDKKKPPMSDDDHIAHKVPPPKKLSPEEKREKDRKLGKRDVDDSVQYVLRNFNPSPRYTQADLAGNRRSLLRKLQSRLYLIIKDKKTGKWKFPDVERPDPLPLRWAAQAWFKRQMSPYVAAHFYANHPLAHYEYEDGTLLFFYHCLYLRGTPPFQRLERDFGWEDHAWVTRNELLEYDFVDKNYAEICHKMLWDGFQNTFSSDGRDYRS